MNYLQKNLKHINYAMDKKTLEEYTASYYCNNILEKNIFDLYSLYPNHSIGKSVKFFDYRIEM